MRIFSVRFGGSSTVDTGAAFCNMETLDGSRNSFRDWEQGKGSRGSLGDREPRETSTLITLLALPHGRESGKTSGVCRTVGAAQRTTSAPMPQF
jgi:hypothetical protein